MTAFEFPNRTKVVFGPGAVDRLGELAGELGFTRTLVVADAGMVAAGYVARASERLSAAGIAVRTFHEFGENPDSGMVAAGAAFAKNLDIDSIVALGGGSSLDCAKGINFLLTQGGTIEAYRGFGKATRAMLPSIGVPTTAGTGSEAQCFAVISKAGSHEKMACGDPRAAFKIAILDPELTVSQPPGVTAAAGYDAMSHAVEAYVTTSRNALSDMYAREAWRLLVAHYARVIDTPTDLEARAAMQMGAYLAGVAIDLSMLGAAHACANPLTARFRVTHGAAIAVMLPHVVRWNAEIVGERYGVLVRDAGPAVPGEMSGEVLARRLEQLRAADGLPAGLRALGVARDELPRLAREAAVQMTGGFNPRPFDAAAAERLYEAAYAAG
jgi:alcohol dehydrogenase